MSTITLASRICMGVSYLLSSDAVLSQTDSILTGFLELHLGFEHCGLSCQTCHGLTSDLLK